MIQEYSQQLQTSVSLKILTWTGTLMLDHHDTADYYYQSHNQDQSIVTTKTLIQAVNFFQRELTIHLDQRICDMDNCPLLKDTP